MRSFHHLHGRLAASGLLAACIQASGCAIPAAPPTSPSVTEAASPPRETTPELIPVVRYGRYTLVELAPRAAQRDLLLQVIDVTLPDTAHATVGDAMRHALLRTGFQLCDGGAADSLYRLPLPAAHLHLGPLPLHDVLLTLAGPTWDLQVDHVARRLCFVRARDTRLDAAAPFASEVPQGGPPAAAALAVPDGGQR